MINKMKGLFIKLQIYCTNLNFGSKTRKQKLFITNQFFDSVKLERKNQLIYEKKKKVFPKHKWGNDLGHFSQFFELFWAVFLPFFLAMFR